MKFCCKFTVELEIKGIEIAQCFIVERQGRQNGERLVMQLEGSIVGWRFPRDSGKLIGLKNRERKRHGRWASAKADFLILKRTIARHVENG